MSAQAFTSGVASQHHTQRIGGDGEEVQGIERPIQVPLTVVANSQQAPSYDYDSSNHLISGQFDEDVIPPNHQRSETIGSDTFVDDIAANSNSEKIGAATLGKPSHPHHSDSDVVSDSIPQDLERERNLGRKEELSPPELKKRVRGNRYRNKYPIDDEESFDEDERKRDDRDRDGRYWDRGRMHSESFREPDRRDRVERYRGDNRNDDWDSRSRTSTRYYNRAYGEDIDDSMSRPRSRNRYYREPDDFYSRPSHRHPHYDDFRRQEERELQYRMQRDRLMYSSARTPSYNAMDVRRQLEEMRLRNPAVYRDWYNKYLAHMRNPTQIPFPSLPGYGAMPSMDTPSFGILQQQGISYSNPPESETGIRHRRTSSGQQSTSDIMPSFVHGEHDSEVENILGNPSIQPFIDTTPVRNTPLKFRNSHSFAIFTPQGQLMRVKGSSGTTIEICGVKQFYQHLPEVKELELFPGPLVKGTTHKKTLIQFCQRKIQEITTHARDGDNENLVLLWEVLVLLLKQNGNVVGSDISELLLEATNNQKQDSRTENHPLTTKTDTDESDTGESTPPEKEANRVQSEKLTKEEIIQQFSNLLLFGHRKDALDYAMNNDLWGHALFLSSKLDERTHSHVLTRFSAVLPANHPLQTLYQMLSGRQPSAVTHCIDDSYGDWRPHLAMILSNSGLRNELESKAIVSLGDTLGFKNQLFAAQFCYLMAQMEFSTFSKLGPLIGYTNQHKNIIEATQMTEIYEFAKGLADSSFSLGAQFVERKLNYMNTLIDYGFLLEAYSYCEEIGKKLLNSNCDNIVHTAFANLIEVGERLKVFCEDPSLVTPQWILALKEKVSWNGDHEPVEIQNAPLTFKGEESNVADFAVNNENNVQKEFTTQNSLQYENTNSQHVDWSYNNNSNMIVQDVHTQNTAPVGMYQQERIDAVDQGMGMRRGSNDQQAHFPNTFDNPPVMYPQTHSAPILSNQPSYGNNNNIYQPQPYGYENSGKFSINSLGSVSDSLDSLHINDKTDNHQPHPSIQQHNPTPSGSNTLPKKTTKTPEKPKGKPTAAESQSGWLGGLMNKFKLKPGNQAILPDDKNPTIVWDPITKKWKDTEQDEDESSVISGPPPTDAVLNKTGANFAPNHLANPTLNQNQMLGNPNQGFGNPNQMLGNPNQGFGNPNQMLGNPNQGVGNPNVGMQNPSMNPSAGVGPAMINANGMSANKYKLPKGLKNNYVDVLNPGGGAQVQKPLSTMGGMGNGVMGVPSFFIPPPNASSSDSGPVSFLTAPTENLMSEDAMHEGNYPPN